MDDGERVLVPDHDRVVLIREDGTEIRRFKLLEDATEYARKRHVIGATLAIKSRRVLAYHAPYGQRIKLRSVE